VQSPAEVELSLMKRGAVLVGMLDPFNVDNAARLAAAGVTAFALEAAPRTTRAQSLDVRSGNVFGMVGMVIAILTTVALITKQAAALGSNLGLGLGLLFAGLVVGGAAMIEKAYGINRKIRLDFISHLIHYFFVGYRYAEEAVMFMGWVV
jgi:NAD/NADP transhydrogenase alpha subunit